MMLHSPIWIETQYGWYILGNPSNTYEQYCLSFFKTTRIAQLVISSAQDNSDQSFESFEHFVLSQKLFGRPFKTEDIWAAVGSFSIDHILLNAPVSRFLIFEQF